jgi:hypothetical protein
MRLLKTAGALGAAAALTAVSACGLLGDDAEQSDEQRLVDMLNESARLQKELRQAEFRIVQSCLEDQGHTVHNQYEMETWSEPKRDGLVTYYPFDDFLPDRETAEKWGFGGWTSAPEGWEGPDAEEYEKERWGDEDESWGDIDNSEFDALPREEQFAWYVAFFGQEKAEQEQSWLLMDFDEETGDEDFYELDETGDDDGAEPGDAVDFENDGQIDAGADEGWNDVRPGGCQLEMIETLYGEPREMTWDSDGYTNSWWTWGPEQDDGEEVWETSQMKYRDRILDAEYDFLDCIADRGHEGWEFTDSGWLPMWEYWAEVYRDGDTGVFISGGPSTSVPEPPADLPSDYEGKRAYEIAMALDFAECAEETNFRETAKTAWEETQLEVYLAIEEDTYRWQDEARQAIERAQDLINA